MAWRRPGDKPLSKPMMVSLLTHIWVARPQWVKQFRHPKTFRVKRWKSTDLFWKLDKRQPVAKITGFYSWDNNSYGLKMYLDILQVSQTSRDLPDDIMAWERFPYYWPFARGIRRRFPSQIVINDTLFDINLNELFNKQSNWRKFETIWGSCDVTIMAENFSITMLDDIPMCETATRSAKMASLHDDVIEWKHFPRYWPFVRGIHRTPVNSPPKSQWRGALMFSLIYAWTNGWANNRDGGDLRRHRAHYDVTVMLFNIKSEPNGAAWHRVLWSWCSLWQLNSVWRHAAFYLYVLPWL